MNTTQKNVRSNQVYDLLLKSGYHKQKIKQVYKDKNSTKTIESRK